MQQNSSRLTVYFDPPFWVGVYERVCDGTLQVAKITFGAEPKDYQVYDYLLTHWHHLIFSPPVTSGGEGARPQNHKRLQRTIKAQLAEHGASTKSRQALQLQREACKTLQQQRTREENEAEKARRFTQRQQKRKEKRRGH